MSLPVLSVSQMRAWESATWKSGQTEDAVIELVGREVARQALEMTGPGARILILAGKGHNGDDARAAIPHLPGREVALVDVADPAVDRAKVQAELARRSELIIDALFGIGLNRPLSREWCELIGVINTADARVLSVDVPSGLSSDTGAHYGEAVRATVTLTVGAPKLGLLSPSAWNYVGRLEVASDVGLAPCGMDSELRWLTAVDFRNYPPRRGVAAHKGTYGHLGIIAGSKGFHGAAVLAARGAQRAQPGLITLQTQLEAYIPVASQLQAVMVAPLTRLEDFKAQFDALLIGPGLAADGLQQDLASLAARLWAEAPVPLVVDASALHYIPAARQSPPAPRVLTPHPGEAARLLGCSAGEVQNERLKALRSLSSRFGGAWVVLKGHETLVGRSSGDVYVNSTGNAYMAQGGSGDLLAGFIAGLLTQSHLASDPARLLSFAVWEHGAAADRLQRRGKQGWIIEDLAQELGTGG